MVILDCNFRPYKITNLILIPARPKFSQPPAKILLLLRMRNYDPVPNISKIVSNYVAELARLVSTVNKNNKNKMPPPASTFWIKVDENHVCYFIWP